MHSRLIVLALLALVGAGCSTYGSSTPSSTVRVPANRPPSATAAVTASVSLSASDASLIRAHYGSAGQDRGPGKGRGRNGGLPPGIAKNLERGKALPPGIARQHLPQDLLLRLPRAPAGLEYLVVAGKLLLVETATQVIRDVLLDAVMG